MAATTKVWVDNSTPTCNAVDLNGFKTENNNLIVGSGLVLDDGDNQQTHEAVAVYAGAGDYYNGGGVANAYVLTAVGSRITPSGLSEGLRIRFVAPVANTGPSTVSATWGIRTLVAFDGSALVGGELQAGVEYSATYDGSDFRISSSSGTSQSSLTLTSMNSPTLAGVTDVPLILGAADPSTQLHLEFGTNVMQAKTDGTTVAQLDLNPLGGEVIIGSVVNNPGGDITITGNSDGTMRFRTTGTAAEIGSGDGLAGRDPTLGQSQVFRVNYYNGSNQEVSRFWFNGTTGIRLESRVFGGDVLLTGLTAVGGAARTMLEADPDAGVTSRYNNTARARTADAGIGFEIQEDTTHGFFRALTELDVPRASQGTSNQGINTDVLTNVTNMSISIPDQGIYQFDMEIEVELDNAAAISYNIGWDITGSNPNVAITYELRAINGVTPDDVQYDSGVLAPSRVLTPAAIVATHLIKVYGSISTNADNTTMQLQLARVGGSGNLTAGPLGHIKAVRL